jgi:hypothetical protein
LFLNIKKDVGPGFVCIFRISSSALSSGDLAAQPFEMMCLASMATPAVMRLIGGSSFVLVTVTRCAALAGVNDTPSGASDND